MVSLTLPKQLRRILLKLLLEAQLLIYPLYPNDGNDSERVFVKQLIQKYVGGKSKKQLFDLTDLED